MLHITKKTTNGYVPLVLCSDCFTIINVCPGQWIEGILWLLWHQAINGIQNMNCCSLESDGIFFHPDDSGRIIHVGPTIIKWVQPTFTMAEWRQVQEKWYFLISYHTGHQQVLISIPPSVLKILGELNSGLPSKIVKDFFMVTHRNNTVSFLRIYPDCESASCTVCITCSPLLCLVFDCNNLFYSINFNISAFHLLQPTSQVTVTSSGRTVKRRLQQLDDDPDQEVTKMTF